MKKLALYFVLLLAVLFTQCHKKDDINNPTQTSPSDDSSDDDTQSGIDDETSYAMSVLSSKAKESNPVYSACNGIVLVVDTLPTTQTDKKKIRMNFDAMIECAMNGKNIKKQGFIEFQLTKGSYWDEAGAEITKIYAAYKEYRKCDSCASGTQLVQIDGIQKITNITGGLIENLEPSDAPITHHIEATNLTVTYSNGKKRTQNTTEVMTGRALSDGSRQLELTGYGNHNGVYNVAIWGSTPSGTPYYVVYNKPKTFNTCSGPGTGKLIDGEAFIKKGSTQIVEIYGVHKNGVEDHTCAGAYGFKRTTTQGDNSCTQVIKY